MNKIEEIKILKNLLNEGAITEDEFVALKKQIISNQKESNTSENSIKQEVLPKPKKRKVSDNTSEVKLKEKLSKESHCNESHFGDGKAIITIISSILSIIAGLIFWERFNFIAFILLTGISITGIAILERTNKEILRNLYLGLISIGLVLLIVFPIGYKSNSSSSSSESHSSTSSGSSYSSDTRTCSYCGKEFSGNGYYHFGTGCVEGDKSLGAGNMCSKKCCSEEWLSDDNNPINHRR